MIVDDSNQNNLYEACIDEDYERVLELYNMGVSIDEELKFQNTNFLIACMNGKVELAYFLLKLGANINKKNFEKKTSLHYAVQNNDLELISMLLKHQPEFESKNSDEMTPLRLACHRNNVVIAEILLKNGADVNSESTHGTSLYDCCLNGFNELFKLLIQYNAKLDFNGKAFNPFITAVQNKRNEIVKIFIANKINISQKDDLGLCSLDYLDYSEKQSLDVETIPEMLFNNNASVNYVDRYKKVPLENALESNNFNLVKLLLSKHCAIRIGANENYLKIILDIKKSLNLSIRNNKKYSHSQLRQEKRDNVRYKYSLN